MKEDRFFWRVWTKREKIPFFLGIFLVTALAVYAVWSWVQGPENIFAWDTITELKEKAVQTPALYFDRFSFSATTPLWYVTESYAPSPLGVNPMAYAILLGGILAGISLILAGLSRLRGAWFLVGALLLGGVLSSFRLESIFLVNRNWPFLAAFAWPGSLLPGEPVRPEAGYPQDGSCLAGGLGVFSWQG
ncbi:MAG: hypothetical protein LRY55_12885 [Leadbetterella sp.]|nr:hypothetical protein [Leadbetterella sp.]